MIQAGGEHNSSFPNFLQTLLQYRKLVLTHITIIMLIAALTAVFTINDFLEVPILWVKAVQVIVFLISGGLYTLLYQTQLPGLNGNGLTGSLFFSFLLSLVICVVLFIFYFFTDRSLLLMAFASSSAFLLPPVLTRSWHYFTHIPGKQYIIWYNPETDIDTRVPIYLNSINIRLQLSLASSDIGETTFNLTVPGQTRVGKVFNQFVLVQNKKDGAKIEILDKNRYPYGWQFFLKTNKGLSERRIDPHQSLRENRIKENSTIIARRVKASMKIGYNQVGPR